jgi:hypothetical protein
MPRTARIPQVDRADTRLQLIAKLLAEVADERADTNTWLERSKAEHSVMWLREQLAARMVDEVVTLVESRSDIPVMTIEDGAPELDALVRELRERLPEAVPRWQLVDFHHAIEAAKPDLDPAVANATHAALTCFEGGPRSGAPDRQRCDRVDMRTASAARQTPRVCVARARPAWRHDCARATALGAIRRCVSRSIGRLCSPP